MFKLAATVTLAAASLGASFAVSAQELLTFNDSWGTPKSRAEVRAELAQAIASGQRLGAGEAVGYPTIAAEGRMLSRAEVRASLVGYIAPHPEAGDALPHAQPVVRMAQAGTVVAR